MGTITLENVRATSDITVKARLKDGGVAIDWSSLTDIKAWLFSDAQKAIAGRFEVSVDQEDGTVLVCTYSARKPQYLGVNRLIVQAKYLGRMKTYDKPCLNLVPRTADVSGTAVVLEDPIVEVSIEVTDVSSSIMDAVIAAAIQAADRAEAAAEAAEHMVDIHTGPAGKSPYIGENGHWFEWDEEAHEYVDTETKAKGDTGETPDITIGTVTTVEPGTPAAATMTGTPEAPVLNLSIPKGLVGSTPNLTVGTVTTGAPGTPVVVTITGTAEAPVLNITIPQGMQGNTGSSVAYPFELVNNLTTDDATKALSAAQGKVLDGKVTELEAEVHNLSGKYYGVFEDSEDLPEGDSTGHAFVGASEPFAIWNFDGEEWADSGATVEGITGEPGVGFASVASPSPADGTVIITLSNGDTITLDLNHEHQQYATKEAVTAIPSGGFLPDMVYELGTLTGTITFTLAAAVTGNANHYFWTFETSSTAPTITWPVGLTWADGSAPTVAANKHYEISVLNGIAIYMEV